MAKQRIIAITGASGGLAQEIVKQLSPSDGIILLGRDKDKLEKCYRHVENKTCLAIDLRDDNAIKKMVDYLYQRFGRIDVFINNAGFGEFKSYDHYTSQEIRDMFDINTFATMTFSRLMAEKWWSKAMAISSTSPVWRGKLQQLIPAFTQRQSLR